jgi:Spy/CpxP family protein refolding chaperone
MFFQPFWRKVVVAGCVCMLGLTVATWSPLTGQEKKAEKPKVSKKEAKGRLPAHYKDVVTSDQRAKIYEIQQKYASQIEDLQSQLESVRKKQTEEIDALLSKEQLDKLTALKAESDAKKKKTSPKKTDAAKADTAKAAAN